jgi:hypothetical protein
MMAARWRILLTETSGPAYEAMSHPMSEPSARKQFGTSTTRNGDHVHLQRREGGRWVTVEEKVGDEWPVRAQKPGVVPFRILCGGQ